MTTARPVYESATTSITIPDFRQRSKIEGQKFAEIKASIEKYGQLQPGLCRRNGDGIILVAGYTL